MNQILEILRKDLTFARIVLQRSSALGFVFTNTYLNVLLRDAMETEQLEEKYTCR